MLFQEGSNGLIKVTCEVGNGIYWLRNFLVNLCSLLFLKVIFLYIYRDICTACKVGDKGRRSK